MKILKKYWGAFAVLILSWWAVGPLFHSGFFSVHDDTQVVRVSQMAQALRDGQFPVRWVADLGYGYGYPIFNFYSPLPYYIGGLFNLIGFDALVATKIMFALGILLSGIFMYLLAREFWGETGGIIAGLFYVYAPYHALDIYVRGAVGEFWAMAFLPLMALGLYKVGKHSMGNSDSVIEKSKVKSQKAKLQVKIKNERWKWLIVGAIGFAGVILSHNLTAIMMIPFLIIAILLYCYIAYKNKKLFTIYYLLFTILLALGLSAFYWLPAILEMGYTNVASQIGGGADFRDHFLCIQQLLDSPWGFGGSAPGCVADGLSFKVGKLHLMLTFASLTLFFFLFRWPKIFCSNDSNHGIKTKRYVVFFAIIILLFSVFMTTQYSQFIWEKITPMAYIQYPWRFLIFIVFTTSFLASSVFGWFKGSFVKLVACGVLLVILLFYNVKYFQPQKYLPLSAQDYINEENIKWKTSKISDEYLPKGFPAPKNENQIVKEKIAALDKFAQVSNLEIKSHRASFNITGENENLILARVAFFPGWTVFVDGREKLFLVQNSQIFFAVPKGQHRVEVVFKNTLVRTVSNALSALSLIILIGGAFYGRKKVSVKD